MKKQIIAWMVLTAIATSWFYAYATNNSTGTINKTEIMSIVKKSRNWEILTADEQAKLDAVKVWNQFKKWKWKKWLDKDWWFEMMWGFGMWFWMMKELTVDEKTKVQAMTDTERKAFFEAKMIKDKADFEAKDAIIDKLINWEALSDSDKVLLEVIKKDRADAKAKRLEMEKKMTEVKVILDKKASWATLTADEQAKLDNMKKEHNWWKMLKWMWMWWK